MHVIERPLKNYVANLRRSMGQNPQRCCELRAVMCSGQQRSEGCVGLHKAVGVWMLLSVGCCFLLQFPRLQFLPFEVY